MLSHLAVYVAPKISFYLSYFNFYLLRSIKIWNLDVTFYISHYNYSTEDIFVLIGSKCQHLFH